MSCWTYFFDWNIGTDWVFLTGIDWLNNRQKAKGPNGQTTNLSHDHDHAPLSLPQPLQHPTSTNDLPNHQTINLYQSHSHQPPTTNHITAKSHQPQPPTNHPTIQPRRRRRTRKEAVHPTPTWLMRPHSDKEFSLTMEGRKTMEDDGR